MKKVLLGTTAIVAAGMIAAPAVSASEKIKLSLGGYMEQWVGSSSQDDPAGKDFSGLHMVSDSEIFFTGKTELDNGLTIGVNVQLEGNSQTGTSLKRTPVLNADGTPALDDAGNPRMKLESVKGGDTIDESYMYISGAFGKVNLGNENSAMYAMAYGPSNYGIGSSSGDQSTWVKPHGANNGGSFFRQPYGSTGVEPGGQNDINRITYYTPRTAGVQFGVSYAPGDNNSEDSGSKTDREAPSGGSDAVAAAINYQGGMGDVAVGLSLGYGQVTNVADGKDEPTAMNAGLTIKVGQIGFGAAYANADDNGANSGTGYQLGMTYDMGPMGISLNYYNGSLDSSYKVMGNDDDRDAGVTETDDVANDGHSEHKTVQLSAKYALGAGVSLNGTLGHTSYESDDTEVANREVDGTYAVVGFKLSF